PQKSTTPDTTKPQKSTTPDTTKPQKTTTPDTTKPQNPSPSTGTFFKQPSTPGTTLPGNPLSSTAPTLQPPVRKQTIGIFGNFTPQGLLIQQVNPGSPGSRAGLEAGDLVLSINGQVVQNQDQYNQVLNAAAGFVQLGVRRNATGQVNRVVVDLTGAGCGRLIAPYLLGATGQFTALGMNVQRVFTGTPAEQAGVRPGDYIQRINGQFINNQQQFFQVLSQSAGSAVLDVRRGGKTA